MAIGIKGGQSSVEPVNLAKASPVELRASPANVEVYDLNELSDLAGEAITDLSACALERLRGDTEFVLYRARSDADTRQILVLAPASEQPSYSMLKRIEHEYALRTELDPAWAVLPFAS